MVSQKEQALLGKTLWQVGLIKLQSYQLTIDALCKSYMLFETTKVLDVFGLKVFVGLLICI